MKKLSGRILTTLGAGVVLCAASMSGVSAGQAGEPAAPDSDGAVVQPAPFPADFTPPPPTPLEEPGNQLSPEQLEFFRDAFADASLSEARELAARKFAEELEALGQNPLLSLDPIRIDEYLSNRTALLDPPGPDDGTLIQATFPLRDESDAGAGLEPLDASLEREGGHLEASNPLVDISLPADAGKPVLLQAAQVGIELESATAGDATPSRFEGETAFYHEAAADTDLLLSPVLSGAELLAQIRSAEAPERLSFELATPADAELGELSDGSVEIAQGGTRLSRITPPITHDAQGVAVESDLAVTGSTSFDLVTEHRAPSVAYPVLVDPIYEDWVNSSWQWHGNANFNGWTTISGNAAGYSVPVTTLNTYTNCPGLWNCFGRGLYLSMGPTWQVAQGAFTHWYYPVPGATTYVNVAWLYPMNFTRNTESGWYTPHAYWGLHSNATGWLPGTSGIPENPSVTNPGTATTNMTSGGWALTPPSPSTPQPNYTHPRAQHVIFGMASSYNRTGGYKLTQARTASLGGVYIGLDDPEPPAVANPINSPGFPPLTGWFGGGSAGVVSVDAAASDPGLGVQSFKLTVPQQTGPPKVITADPNPVCSGKRSTGTCPSSRLDRITFNSSQSPLPEGINTATLRAQDPVAKSTERTFDVRVDRTPPVLQPSGGLYAPAEGGYELFVAGRDGEDGTQSTADRPGARSGMKRIDLYFEEAPAPIATTGNHACASAWGSCELTLEYDDFDPLDYPEGEYSFHLVGVDQLDHETDPVEWTRVVEHTPPTISSIGGPATENWLRSGTPNLNVTASDEGAGVKTIGLTLPGGDEVTHEFSCQPSCQDQRTASFQLNVNALPQGVQTLEARGYGPDGQAGPARAVDIRIDRTAPEPAASGPDSWIREGDFAIEIGGQDPTSGVESVAVTLPGGTHLEHEFDCQPTCPTSASHVFEVPVASLPQGDHVATGRAYGPGGFPSAPAEGPVRIDRSAPVLAAAGPLVDSPLEQTFGLNSQLELSVDDQGGGVKVIELSVDGEVDRILDLEEVVADGAEQACTAGNCQFEYTFAPDVAQEAESGEHAIEISVTDVAGHTATVSNDVTLDAAPPELRVDGDLVEWDGLELPGSIGELEIEATDSTGAYDSGVERLLVTVDDQVTPHTVMNCDPQCPPSGERTFLYDEAIWGTAKRVVTVEAVDALGNASSEEIWVNAPTPAALAPECPTEPPVTTTFEGTEKTPSQVAAGLEEGFPGVLEPSAPLADEGQNSDGPHLEPTLGPGGGSAIEVKDALEAASIVSEASGAFDVGAGACLAPLTTTEAEGTGEIIQGDSLIRPNSAPSSDTVLRPTVAGTAMIHHVRGPGAPESVSWRVELGQGQELIELPDGGIAVVDATGADLDGIDVPDEPDGADNLDDLSAAAVQAGVAEHEIAAANEAVTGEVAVVFAAPYGVTETGAAVPAELSVTSTNTIRVNFEADGATSLVIVVQGISPPSPATLCAQAYAGAPGEYVKWCLDEADLSPSYDPDADPAPDAATDPEFRADWDASTQRLAPYFAAAAAAGGSSRSPGNALDGFATKAEVLWCGAHLVACGHFIFDAKKANELSSRLWSVTGRRDGIKSNAFRHAVWVSLMVESSLCNPTTLCQTDTVGPNEWAFDAARAHEEDDLKSDDTSTVKKAQMDMINNFIGYKVGQQNHQEYDDGDFCKETFGRARNAVWIGTDVFPKKWRNRNDDYKWRLVYRRLYHSEKGEKKRHVFATENCEGVRIK